MARYEWRDTPAVYDRDGGGTLTSAALIAKIDGENENRRVSGNVTLHLSSGTVGVARWSTGARVSLVTLVNLWNLGKTFSAFTPFEPAPGDRPQVAGIAGGDP